MREVCTYLVQVRVPPEVLVPPEVPVPIPALAPVPALAVVQEVQETSLVASEAEKVAPHPAAQTQPSCCSQQN